MCITGVRKVTSVCITGDRIAPKPLQSSPQTKTKAIPEKGYVIVKEEVSYTWLVAPQRTQRIATKKGSSHCIQTTPHCILNLVSSECLVLFHFESSSDSIEVTTVYNINKGC